MVGRTPLSGSCQGQRPLLLCLRPVSAASRPLSAPVCPVSESLLPPGSPSMSRRGEGYFWGVGGTGKKCVAVAVDCDAGSGSKGRLVCRKRGEVFRRPSYLPYRARRCRVGHVVERCRRLLREVSVLALSVPDAEVPVFFFKLGAFGPWQVQGHPPLLTS